MILKMEVPSPGESITEVEIVEWLRPDGSWVEKDEGLCEIESEKVTLTIHAEESGRLKILVEAKTTVKVGEVACTIDTDASPDESEKVSDKPAREPIPEPPESVQPVEVTPESLPRVSKSSVSKPSAARPAFPLDSRPVRREKMTQLRKKVSERLVAVKNQTAMLTTFNEVDMSVIKDIRAKYRDRFEEQHGVRLGFMSFFVRAVCEALVDYPSVGAIIDGDGIIYPEYVDIGIAVSAQKGLVVPVVRNAHEMTFAQIERAIFDLSQKTHENKLTMDELTGGTFTITNGGVFGSLLSTPILNPPQSAILGMHVIQERPIAKDGAVVIRPMMYVALSYDHRVIDGKESVSFLKRVKEFLEDPVKLLLGIG
jgi:2-oxoglutarate dehydrogenase E2 component (dihydrolipoamide succinyltransferase)